MKTRKMLIALAMVGLVFGGCTSTSTNMGTSKSAVKANSDWKTKASPKVKKMLEKGGFEVVDTNYIKSFIGKGTRSSKFILVDTRPMKKFMGGHVPSSYIVPDTKFEEYYPTIASMDKNTEIITYCGGWKCGKSPKVALLLKAKGWKNVKVYQEGEPAWRKKGNYSEVEMKIVQSVIKRGDGVIIDARPAKVYKRSHIPTSINVPDTKFQDYIATLPADKNTKIITYCGGYKCAKSHKVAKELIKLGYKKVFVYAAGLPQWKKKGMALEKAGKKAAKKVESANYITVNGVQLVKEQEDNAGMVYGDFFKKAVKGEFNDIVIVDVRTNDEWKEGTIPNSVNISVEDNKPAEFLGKVEKIVKTGKKVILICSAGARATEAMTVIQDNKGDTNSIFFADINLDCDKNNQCSIDINDPI